MRTPMTLQALEGRRPGGSPLATTAMAGVLGLGLNLPGRRMRFAVEGWERIPDRPVVLVANHTHWLDWIALRWVGWRRGRHLANWVKPRTYEDGYAGFLDATNNVPVTSRGYLLSADVRAVRGDPPTEAEYRALRDHLDSGAALPEGRLYRDLCHTPRRVLGLDFDPQSTTYRAFIERLFHAMMQATLHHTRVLRDRGVDLQVMPQGVTSVRLTPGHSGALQAALALDMDLVPVGINNFPQAYGKRGVLPVRGGVVTVRVGEPWRPSPIAGLIPFLPESERAHRAALTEGTADMMDRIAVLLDPVHRKEASSEEADVTGVARFV